MFRLIYYLTVVFLSVLNPEFSDAENNGDTAMIEEPCGSIYSNANAVIPTRNEGRSKIERS